MPTEYNSMLTCLISPWHHHHLNHLAGHDTGTGSMLINMFFLFFSFFLPYMLTTHADRYHSTLTCLISPWHHHHLTVRLATTQP